MTVGLITVVVIVALSNVLPYYLSPVIALLTASGLYFYIFNFRIENKTSCVMVPLAILYCIVGYAFITIIINMLSVWNVIKLPHEFLFFTHPFIPSLILNPVSFIVLLWIYFQHDRLKICVECRMRRNLGGMRGAGGVLKHEAHFQLKNFTILSFFLSVIVWVYYWAFYNDININGRDTYIFTWLTILGILVDEIYFSIRYYNLYLDFKEGDEILTQEEIDDMTSTTYIRYYVICGNYIFLNTHAHDPNIPSREVIDTPFFTHHSLGGMINENVESIISKMTGVKNGTLKFFYGRKSNDEVRFNLLRYFYFLNGSIEDYKNMPVEGEWISFDKVKYIYSTNSSKLAEFALYDFSRLATIMLTEKIFDEEGNRKSKIKSYNPTFNLEEVRNSDIDFHDDKWIRISMFNSDVKMYKLKKWWRQRRGK